jgi:hypothetical protein
MWYSGKLSSLQSNAGVRRLDNDEPPSRRRLDGVRWLSSIGDSTRLAIASRKDRELFGIGYGDGK